MKTMYTTSATAENGRKGRVATPDGKLDLQLSMPKEMGGDGGPGTNPEQLFASGYSACFLSAVELVAKKKGIPVDNGKLTAEISIGKNDDGSLQLAAKLQLSVPGLEQSQIEELLQEAHQVCPYSRATRNNIDVELAAV
ncbi:organic hydroperoxide resistance protein [Paenibacillus sp. FJAT-26967]|uniref:organic hydroperoxide resistance protein n=1 Tax=Paenibacillus sp. FJAT-26967 TaxID=1729690 RepID=UPI000838D87B|nr:organic hydroperoxide resistance protein [Paenibacillus sp. FJAT-26967]